MSVEKVQRKGRDVWRVRWRDASGQPRSKVLGRKQDAITFDAEAKRAKRLGTLAALDGGKQTLHDFSKDWWALHAVHLADKTQGLYAYLYDAHIDPRLGSLQLREITVEVVTRWHSDVLTAGVGPVAARKALTLLGGMLERGCEWQRIPANPVRYVRRAPLPATRAVRPLAPEAVEGLRAQLEHRDAVLVSVLAYAGLRPGEALGLSWAHVRDKTLLIERAASQGSLKSTKTGQRRTVPMLSPVAADLAEWRLASRRPPDEALVFPSATGDPWQEIDWQYWRRYVYGPAAKLIGFESSRPYDLRHSYASLRILEGANVIEIARHLGHDARLTLSTYGHMFDDASGGQSAEDLIRAAREKREGVSGKCPPRSAPGSAVALESA